MFHRPLMLIALLITLVLSGCQSRLAPEAVSSLDDVVVLNLMSEMKQSIREGDKLRWQGFFAKDTIIENINSEGVRFVSGRKDIFRIMGEYMEHGRGFDMKNMDQLIIVSEDRQRAVVKKSSKEIWMFNDKYEDISTEVEHYLEWKLINGVPQITRMIRYYKSRELISRTDGKDIAPMWMGDGDARTTSIN